MRLAILSPQSPAERGSSATARLEMFEHLPKGWEADLYYFGKRATATDVSIGRYRPEGHPSNISALVKLIRIFVGHNRQRRYDYVWTTTPPIMMALFAAIAAKLTSLPLIVDVRDPGISSVRLVASADSWIFWIAWRLERWLYQRAQMICCTTPELAKFLAGEFRIDSHKFHVVGNAGPYKRIAKARSRPSPFRLFFAGSFAPYQVIALFLKKLIQEKPNLPKFQIDLYGYEEKGDKLSGVIGRESSWIRLHGPVDRQDAFIAMRRADAVLVPIDGLDMPDLYDYAIPLKYYEASAESKPILLFGGTKASRNALDRDRVGINCTLDGSIAEALQRLILDLPKFQKAANQTAYLRKVEAQKLFTLLK